MKWLVIIPRYLPEKVGGNITYVNLFSKALTKQGHTVHIVTTTRSKTLQSTEVIEGVTVHRVHVNRGNMGPLWLNYTSQVTNYIKRLDQSEQFEQINPHGPFMVNIKSLRKDINIIYTLHAVVSYEYLFRLKKLLKGGWFNKETIKALIVAPILLPMSFIREWLAVNEANQVIVMSHYVKGTINKFLPAINLNKVFVSRIGIDENFQPSHDKKRLKESCRIANHTTLLTVRRLERRMGLENLIMAFSILKQRRLLSGVKLYVAGKGSLKISLEKLINERKLSDTVELLGFVSDDKLKQWYQVSDAFVLPTEELEGFGIVTIEAFASGLPVIATPAGANPEVAGKFCKELLSKTQNSPLDLANSVEVYLKNKEKFNAINYSQAAREHYNWTNIISEIVKEIEANA